MKYSFIVLAALILNGCVKQANIEITGLTPGIKSGVFIVKNTSDSTILGENIKNGEFSIKKKPLKEPGYYTLKITEDDVKDNREPVEIYLEDGKYTIETVPGDLYLYPKIVSPSKIQEQLSAFYTMADQLNSANVQRVMTLRNELKAKGAGLDAAAYSNMVNRLSAIEIKMLTSKLAVFKQFVKQYPNSEISAHLMSKLNYEEDPVSYYTIYQTLSPAAKNTDEGKEIGSKLSRLIKLIPGVKAPALTGNTPDGKPFDPKSIDKKLVLLDFWRADDDISRLNHPKLTGLLADANSPNLEIISVSMDTKRDWWTTAIRDDHMAWPQVSDLKGDDSPNTTNWAITKIPTYYLLDSNWNIVERDIDIRNVNNDVSDYLKKH